MATIHLNKNNNIRFNTITKDKEHEHYYNSLIVTFIGNGIYVMQNNTQMEKTIIHEFVLC